MNIIQRKHKAKKNYDQSRYLHVTERRYREHIQRFIIGNINDDLAKDITTKKIIGRRQKCSANLIAKSSGIVAGLEELRWMCRKFSIKITLKKSDGQNMVPGTVLAVLFGNGRTIFGMERSIVNAIQRLAGIATYTQQLKQLVGPYPLIAATRKTLWGQLDKKAVSLGGGYTHRLGLHDAVLVKDNHLTQLENFEAVKHVHFKRKWFKEIELTSLDQLKQLLILELPFDAIMFDNFSPQQIKRAIRLMENRGLRNRYICEASGGITKDTIQAYVKTGVDVVSLGSLTHSASAVDVSLEMTP